MSALRVERLTARYGGQEILHDLNLTLPAGELHAVLGPSGCGKTTLLRCIAGLKRPDDGRIFVDEEDVTEIASERRGIVLLHQENALFPHLDVERNVAFGLRLQGQSGPGLRLRVDDLLHRVDLEGYGPRRIDQLSGGERQRVALARALAVSPRIVLLDEPLSFLDEPLRVSLRGEIRRILRDAGATAYYVTHDREEAFAVADQLVLLDEGRIVDAGSPRRVHDRPATPQAARLLGHRNILDYTPSGPGRVSCILGDLSVDESPARPGKMLLPEDRLELRAAGPGPPVTVEGIEYLGGRFRYRVRTGPQTLWVQTRHDDGLVVGREAVLDVTATRPVLWPQT